jgi:hypothetical protein
MPRVIAFTLVAVLLAHSARSARATLIEASRTTNFLGQNTASEYMVSSFPGKGNGDFISVMYTPASGGPPITVHAGKLDKDGKLTVNVPAMKGTTVRFINITEATSARVAAGPNFNPPGQIVTTTLAVAPGSTAALGGSTFDLGGSFTTIATEVDYDPTSPTYGNLGGLLPASEFDLHGTGTAGSFDLALSGDLPWTANLADIWGKDVAGRLSVPFSTPLFGKVAVGPLSSPFSGTAIGTVTFFADDSETISGSFDFTSGFGGIQGTLTASGSSVWVPEPSTVTLLCAGAVVVCGWRAVGRPRPTIGPRS